MPADNTIGCIEKVDLPELGIRNILAKVDTGAFTGALHSVEIRVVKVKGVKVLKFRPISARHSLIETTDFYERHVRSASGHRTKRYIVPIKIRINGSEYDTHIGLSDRKDMKRKILLGRRFIRQNNMLVDVRINQELDDEKDVIEL